LARAERPQRIVLVGFMGSGKSAVGRELARLLGWRLLDMDSAIEQHTGLTVAELFRERGEAAFREEERRVALATQSLSDHVIAAGGGAFASAETREALQKGAVSVWLRCELPLLLARIEPDGSRPLAGSRETIARLFKEREPSYRMADRIVDASDAAVEVARRVVEAVFPRPMGTRENLDR
jgi:shikimate kinase